MLDPKIVLFGDWSELSVCAPRMNKVKAGEIAHKLRRLILDGNSLVNIVNRDIGLRIRFPILREFRESLGPGIEIFHKIDTPVRTLRTLDDQYLQVDLGRFLGFGILRIGDQLLTVGDVIKAVANNLGGVHFDERRWREKLEFNPHQKEFGDALCAVIATIARTTSIAIESLARKAAPFPPEDHFICHHDMEDEVYGFDGRGYLSRVYDKPIEVGSLSIFAAIELQPILESETPIYTVDDVAGEEWLRISANNFGTIIVTVRIAGRTQKLQLEDNGLVRPVGKTVTMMVVLSLGGQWLDVEIRINNNLRKFSFPCVSRNFFLGGDLVGACSGGSIKGHFRLHEFIVLKSSDVHIINRMLEYFYFRYRLHP